VIGGTYQCFGRTYCLHLQGSIRRQYVLPKRIIYLQVHAALQSRRQYLHRSENLKSQSCCNFNLDIITHTIRGHVGSITLKNMWKLYVLPDVPVTNCAVCRSRWPRKCRYSAALLLEFRLRISLREKMFVSCLYVVVCCVGRGLCEGFITSLEESYRASNCMCLRNYNTEGKAQIWAVVP
jgi:hypothetical protein